MWCLNVSRVYSGDNVCTPMKYLLAYPSSLQQQVQDLIAQDKLAALLQSKYPSAHGLRTDSALFGYVTGLKNEYLRNADAVNKVVFDSKIHVINNALGLHTTVSRVQGSKLKAKHEIKIGAMFKDVPLDFLRMISVHELAHLKERNHDKPFYKLCTYMEPSYHLLELDVRLYLTHLELTGQRLWGG